MTNLEKLNALQAGEFDKVLEGTPYAGAKSWIWGAPYNIQASKLLEDAQVNAAKVEVTKGVLDEVEHALEGACNTIEANGMGALTSREALTLLKTLWEAL